MTHDSILSILAGAFALLPLFLYFRPRMKEVLSFRLGRTETARRLNAYPRLARFFYPGFQKHLSPVWRLMNLLLPLSCLLGVLLGTLGFFLSQRVYSLIGLLFALDLLALSLWLMLANALFSTLSAWKQIEIEKFSCALFFITPIFLLCLRFFP